jgi:superfamily II DNA or RNA helicase
LDAWLSVYDMAAKRPPLELTVSAARRPRPGLRADAETIQPSHDAMYRLSAAFIGGEGLRVALRDIAKAGGNRAGEALSFAALLSSFIPSLGRLGVDAFAELTEGELAGFVIDAAPLLERFGVAIVLPKDLRRLARPRPALRARKKSALVSYLDLASAFSFDWTVAIGDERLSVTEFAALVDTGLRLVRWRDQWVRIDAKEAAGVLARVSERKPPGSMEALRLALSGEAEVEGELAGAVEFLLGSGRGPADGTPVPASLRASLRPYQERGYRWMLGNFERGLGCLLADDMGLGKTVQTIAAMLFLKEAGRLGTGRQVSGALVCAPASLLSNWERELSKFAPTLSVCTYYGKGRRLRPADVALSSYETWIRDQKKLGDLKWSLVVLDEAHYIKNPESRRAKAVKAIRSVHRLALTGTPVENNLAELWSVFDFALPGYLGSLSRFSTEYRRPIELDRSEEAAGRLRAVTAPFIMRRLKTDDAIVADLPDKVIVDEYAVLTPAQAALYEAVVSEGMARVTSSGPENRLGLVLALITALKQVSNHPRNYDKESQGGSERSGKSRLLLALLESAFEAGERVLVFSQYVQMLDILAGVVRDELGVEPYILHGGLSRKRRDEQVGRFQAERGPGVFLVSLKAGGVGLNLTAATRVVHYDLWFNPAVENQATDRAFRIGQTKNVFVHRLITRDTIEERIDAMIASKRGLSDLTVRAGESWIADLGDAELRELLALR